MRPRTSRPASPGAVRLEGRPARSRSPPRRARSTRGSPIQARATRSRSSTRAGTRSSASSRRAGHPGPREPAREHASRRGLPARLAQLASAEGDRSTGPARSNQTYELRKTTQGGFLVRYLPPGTAVRRRSSRAYRRHVPRQTSLRRRQTAQPTKGASISELAGGGLAVVNPRFPKSVYIAYPGLEFEIEVFDPSLARARALVASGQITAIG